MDTEQCENPFVAVAAKKYRNLKKKLDKIEKIDALRAAGKELNNEQIATLKNKSSVEKAIADVESIKLQLEEVAANLPAPAPVVAESAAPVMMSTSVGTSKPTEEVDGDKAEVVAEVEPQSEEDQAALELKEKEAADKHSAAVMRAVEDHVFKLLKALHVCSRYTVCTGQALPVEVEYFGKNILGLNSSVGFIDTLQNSYRHVGAYLQPIGNSFEHVSLVSAIDTLAFQIADHELKQQQQQHLQQQQQEQLHIQQQAEKLQQEKLLAEQQAQALVQQEQLLQEKLLQEQQLLQQQLEASLLEEQQEAPAPVPVVVQGEKEDPAVSSTVPVEVEKKHSLISAKHNNNGKVPKDKAPKVVKAAQHTVPVARGYASAAATAPTPAAAPEQPRKSVIATPAPKAAPTVTPKPQGGYKGNNKRPFVRKDKQPSRETARTVDVDGFQKV